MSRPAGRDKLAEMVITKNGGAYTEKELEQLSKQVECSVSEFEALRAWLERRVKTNGGKRADSDR